VVERHRTGTGTRTMKTTDTTAERILTQFKTKGRHNFNKNGRAIKPKAIGYIVSQDKGIKVIDKPLEHLNFKEIEQDLKALIKRVRATEFIGLWLDNGIIYIDISRVIQSKENALKLAKEQNQKAIFDIKNNKVIFVKK
jgi:hypothetical protein